MMPVGYHDAEHLHSQGPSSLGLHNPTYGRNGGGSQDSDEAVNNVEVIDNDEESTWFRATDMLRELGYRVSSE